MFLIYVAKFELTPSRKTYPREKATPKSYLKNLHEKATFKCGTRKNFGIFLIGGSLMREEVLDLRGRNRSQKLKPKAESQKLKSKL
jgi:hypothetical protein